MSKTRGLPSIDSGVNLLGQAASAASEGICLSDPPFAPALCWWAHNGRIDHGCTVVRIPPGFEPRCHTPVLLQRECLVCNDAKVAESRWQVAPGDACAVAVQHGIDEQAVVLGCGSRLTCLAGQQILDALPLRIAEAYLLLMALYIGA